MGRASHRSSCRTCSNSFARRIRRSRASTVDWASAWQSRNTSSSVTTGTIVAANRPKGGAVFAVQLPRAATFPAPSEAPRPRFHPTAGSMKPARVRVHGSEDTYLRGRRPTHSAQACPGTGAGRQVRIVGCARRSDVATGNRRAPDMTPRSPARGREPDRPPRAPGRHAA